MSGYTEIEVPQTLHIETAEEGAPAERPPSKRDEAMAAIAQRREEQIARELAHGVLMEDEARATGGGQPLDREAPTDDPPAHREAAEAPAAPPHAAPAPAPEPMPDPRASLREVTVGGQSFWVSEGEMNRLAGLGALAQSAMNQQPREPPAPAAPATPPAPAAPILDADTSRAVVRRLVYGNEEDGVAALQDLVNTVVRRAAPQQHDPRQIVAAATQQAMMAMQLQQDLRTLGSEYPDVFGPMDRPVADPTEHLRFRRLSEATAQALRDIQQKDAMLGRQRPEIERYREAADEVRSVFIRPASPAPAETRPQAALQAAPVAPQQERLERKRAAPRQPSAVSRVASAGESIRQEPTPSEVVAWIARKRNQQSPVSTR